MSSTSNTNVEFGGVALGTPAAPPIINFLSMLTFVISYFYYSIMSNYIKLQ